MKPRKLLFWLHLVVGLGAGLFILSMAVTGMLISFEHQITEWADSRTWKIDKNATVSFDNIEKLLQKAPEKPGTVTLKREPGVPIELNYGKDKNTIFIHPQTGENLGMGSASARQIFPFLIHFHRWLALDGQPREIAKLLTGVACLCFFFLVVSGLILWFPKKLAARFFAQILWFKSGVKGKARDWNWHNVIGFWLCLPLLIITITGLVIAFPWANNLLFTLTGKPGTTVKKPPTDRSEHDRSTQAVPSDFTRTELPPLLNQIAFETKDWNLISVKMPLSNKDPISIAVDRGNGHQPHLRHSVNFHATTGALLGRELFSDHNAGRQLRMLARYVHTGEAGGVWGQIIALTAASGTVMLVYTGFALSWRRFFRTSPQRAATTTQPIEI